MGYCVQQINSKFLIRTENISNCLNAIQALANLANYAQEQIRSGNYRERYFPWVHTEEIKNVKNIGDAFNIWGYEICCGDNETEDITEIYFIGEKLGQEGIMFEAIAPYVEDGSFIEMLGEDGERWKWCFENGELVEKNAKIVYED